MGIQPMTAMGDVEMQTIHADPDILQKKKNKVSKDCIVWSTLPILIVVVVTCAVTPIILLHLDAHYYVAIDSASDLDPMRGLSFNLTLGVSSRSYGTKACIKPGSYVEVSYRGVLLASSEAQVGRICAGPRKSAQQRVVARTTMVPEGNMLDILAADMKLAAPVYQVTLHLPPGSYGVSYEENNWWVSGCGLRGVKVGAAPEWCDAPDQN